MTSWADGAQHKGAVQPENELMEMAKKRPGGRAVRAISLFAVTREGPAQGGKAGCEH